MDSKQIVSAVFCRALRVLCAAWLVATPTAAGAHSQVPGSNYIIGPQDVLTVTVWDQADLTGKFAVDADGTFTFPLIGRLKAGGLTLQEFEAEMKRRLSDGFFKNPQITVAVEQYRSQRVFVVGEVKNAGSYAVSGDMTLIEALAKAGSTTEVAAGEAILVRPGRASDGPTLPDQSK